MNLTIVNTLAELERAGWDVEYTSENEIKCLCPFHDDQKPSCFINIEKKVFKCQTAGCEASGDLVTFLAGVLKAPRKTILVDLQKRYGIESVQVISPKTIERYHNAIWAVLPYLKALHDRGIIDDLIRKYRIGFDKGRITIPITNASGSYVNVRKYLPGAPGNEKMRNTKSHGQNRLYPPEQLKYDTVVVCGGELKAILAADILNPLDIGAISTTAGEGNWQPEFTEKFKGKCVYVCYDIDNEGNVAANSVCARLRRVVRFVGKVDIPLSLDEFPHGDVNDWKPTTEGFKTVLDGTEEWKLPKTTTYAENNGEVLELSLADSINAEFAAKRIAVNATITTIDTAPYLVPKQVNVICDRNQENCSKCPIFGYASEESKVTIPPDSPAIIAMVGTPSKVQREAIREGLNIPECKSVRFESITYYNVQDARVSPQLKITSRSAEHLMQPSLCIGKDLELNTEYRMVGRVFPHPATQQTVILISEYAAIDDALSTYVPSAKTLEQLEIFQGDPKTKLDEIYEDLEANVTRIYQRRDMHILTDLIYHSALLISFEDRVDKGWCEGLILGDSSQGKTETTTRLMQHYGLGEKMVCKNATVAGLLGGLQQINKRWFATWGVIPTHDKRLVILEELKGVDPEVFGRLTDMRSSGVAEISKIEKRRAHARTRLLCISNPRSDQPIASYAFGLQAVKELIGGLEDVRRFDVCIIVGSEELDSAVLNRLIKDKPKVKHRYTSEVCRQLVLWAWTRTEDQIHFTPNAKNEILKQATNLCDLFSESIPIVDRGSMRFKLARLATALACRLFSTEDGKVVVVRKLHVDYIVEYLTRIYSTRVFGYREYSQSLKVSSRLLDNNILVTRIRQTPFPSDLVRSLLSTIEIELIDVQDWCGWDRPTSSALLSLFVRKNAMRRKGKAYIKSPEFVELLKHIEVTDRPNHVTTTEEF